MSKKMLDAGAISSFCEGLAVMYRSGIQTDEAVSMLSENTERGDFKRVCEAVYASLISGQPLAQSMKSSGAFPDYALSMVAAGEHSGHLESVLWSLASYYDEEERLYKKVTNAIAYPTALLCVMSLILVFIVFVVLPVFVDVYESFGGSIVTGSFGYVSASLIIGRVALGITLAATLLVLICLLISRSSGGRAWLIRLMSKMPVTRKPLLEMAIGRFSTALATCIAAGMDTDTAMSNAMEMVDHTRLRAKLERAYSEMTDTSKGKSLAQAIQDNNVFNPIYSRMLMVGSRAGSMETVLQDLSETFFQNSISSLDRLIDSVEPVLAAFLTISVGCTLIAVMLPLIGIMGSIG